MREQLVHARAEPRLWAQLGDWGLSPTPAPWQQPAHTHGAVLREESPEGEHLCRKRSCKMCYGEKIHIGGAARGHFQTTKLPPKERSKNAKRYRGVPGKQMRPAINDVNILPLFLFALSFYTNTNDCHWDQLGNKICASKVEDLSCFLPKLLSQFCWMCIRTKVLNINNYYICFPVLLQLQKWAIVIFIVHDRICQLWDRMNSHNRDWLSLKVINMSR